MKRGAESVSPSSQRPSRRPRLDFPISPDTEITAIGNYDDSKELLDTLLNHHHFRKVRQDLEHLCEKLRSGVRTEDGGETDSQTRDFLNVLHEVEARLSNLDANCEPMVVALSGRMGAGKSALINSILSEPGLAKESGGALAGTRVVHVFKYKEADQRTRFRRQIKYFTNPQIEVMVKRNARTLFRWAHSKLDDANGEDDEDQDDEVETWDMQERTIKAHLFFDHGFSKLANKPFDDEPSARIFFGKVETEDDSRMLRILTEATQNGVMLLLKTHSDHELVADLRRDFAANASDVAWEVVETIETCLEHPFLKHITLGDTAGSDDTDRDRVEKSVDYLRDADIILLVHTISRVANDESVVSDIAWLRKNNLLKKATLVCPKLDQHLKLEDEALTKDDITKLEMAKAERIAASKAAKESGLQEAEKCHLLAKKEFLTRCEKDARVSIRIRETRTAVGARLQQMRHVVPTLPNIPVVCVSNKEYSNHLKDPDDEDDEDYEQPILNIRTTGIPVLRRYLKTFAETRILQTMSSEVLEHLRRGVQDQIMHERHQHTVYKAELLKFVEDQSPDCQLLIDRFAAETRNGLLIAVIKKMVQNKHHYVKDTISQIQSLRRSRFPRYVYDQCRRNGAPTKNKTDDWNQLVVTAFEQDVETGMEQLRKFIKDKQVDVLNHLHDIVERVWNKLQKLLRSTQKSDNDFFQSYRQHYSQFAMRVNGLRKVLVKKHLSQIQQNLLDFESDEMSYVKSAMLPHYKAAFRVTAGTKKSIQQRTNIIELAISGPDSNIFDKVGYKIVKEFDDVMAQWVPMVEVAMDRLWRDVKKDIRIRFTANEDHVPSEASERFKELLGGSQGILRGRIQTDFEECSAYVKQARDDSLV